MSDYTHLVPVLKRMREILSDPERVVLNPHHYAEIDKNGKVIESTLDMDYAARQKIACRVCMCGAAALAAYEVAYEGNWANDPSDDEEEVQDILTEKAQELGVPKDEEVFARWKSGPSAWLTSALKHGMAVQVVDAVLADIGAPVTS